MRVRLLGLLLLALTLVIAIPGTALARSQDPNNPELLRPREPRTGVLPGSPAGSFAFFAVEYPGGDQDLVIRMTPRPSDPSVSAQIAFNVYGPDGLIGSSATAVAEGDPSVRQFSYGDADPARLLVQIYNYTLTDTITYSIVATGFSEATQAPAATPTPAAPETLPETGAPVSGTLVGSLAGAFAVYELSYPGDGSSITVEATIAPDDPVIADAVGFNVYDPNGRLVAEGTTRSTPGRRQATFSSAMAGSYAIQVYNYTDGTPVSYTLSW